MWALRGLWERQESPLTSRLGEMNLKHGEYLCRQSGKNRENISCLNEDKMEASGGNVHETAWCWQWVSQQRTLNAGADGQEPGCRASMGLWVQMTSQLEILGLSCRTLGGALELGSPMNPGPVLPAHTGSSRVRSSQLKK